MRFAIDLPSGGLGENLVLDGIVEDEVFAGDIVQAGTALVQVSGPRVPCLNQARHVGRSDWVRLTIQENRTGFYLRVLQPGVIRPGDPWRLEQRLNAVGSITAINRCFYQDFDREFAMSVLSLNGLADWWKEQFVDKLQADPKHEPNTSTE
jgi:MOSC domain-containing protein YiiM